MSCYIMQRDEICPDLTVLESTMFATCIKMGNRINQEQKNILVKRKQWNAFFVN